MNIIGIDPGKDGGLAIISSDRRYIQAFSFTNLSEKEIYGLIVRETFDPCRAFLEKVGAMRGQGVTSMFTFGQGYGFLRACLYATGTPFEDVPPQTWQKGVGLGGLKGDRPDRKRQLKAGAERLFPQIKVTLSTADALLIAEYGHRLIYRKG